MATKKRTSPSETELRRSARPKVADATGDDLGAAEMARRVADVLKRFRKVRDLSLDELSAKSGVSRAALSQIEGARTNPTLTVLWKIAVGLEIPFQALLEGPEDSGAKVLRASDVTPLRSADGRMESRLLSPGGSPPGLELYELRFQPKAVHRSDPHSKGTSETLVVLKGALRVVVGEAEYELLTGDSIFFTADVTHVYENRASHEARCLDIINYGRAG